jgi:hypothetical protein
MNLVENKYEDKLLMDLPPNARDIALDLFARTPLGKLLQDLQMIKPNTELLAEHKVAESYWKPILQAATLAKITYFLPNGKYSQEEILYLLKVVCLCVDYPQKNISFYGVAFFIKTDMPTLHNWLNELSKLMRK